MFGDKPSGSFRPVSTTLNHDLLLNAHNAAAFSDHHRYARRMGVTLLAVIVLLLVWCTLHMFLLIFLGIISAQIIMGVVQGVLGIMVAIPLVAVIVVLTKLLYLENTLGEDDIEIQTENRAARSN